MSIRLEHLSLDYQDGGIIRHAVRDVSLEIEDNTFVGLIGHTGSGKSSLIQHMNGLIRPTSGKIYYNGEDIYQEGYSLRQLRNKVGLVFQYPEHQLFEESVFKDVCYGPRNQGLTDQECEERAREALRLVGFPEELYKKSPFELSGGQKRRAAIAGVLAMNPEVLKEERHITIILVSHSMEDMALYAERLVVMNHGRIAYDGKPREIFSHYKELEKIGLAAPQVTYLMHALREKGFDVSTDVMTVAEARAEILRVFGRKKTDPCAAAQDAGISARMAQDAAGNGAADPGRVSAEGEEGSTC